MQGSIFVVSLLCILPRSFETPVGDETFVKCNEDLSTTSVPVVTCQNLALTEVPDFGNSSLLINQLLLDRNSIRMLFNNTFNDRRLLNLERIDLSHNILDTIDLSAFSGLKRLTYLDISFNNLGWIAPEVFGFVRSLTVLTMEGNPLNKLIGGFDLPNLTTLDMTRCSLKTLPQKFFEETTRLARVYLSNNDLSGNFSAELWIPLSHSLNIIEMKANSFTRLPPKLLSLGVDRVKLEGNPWHCDCDFVKSVAEYNNTTFYKRLICATPRTLSGLSLSAAAGTLKCDNIIKVTKAIISSTNDSPSITRTFTDQSPTIDEPLVLRALERRQGPSREETMISHPLAIYYLNIVLAAVIIGILLALTFYVLQGRIVNYYCLMRGTQHCYQTIGDNSIIDRVDEPIYEVIH